jgi:hypothetical protein
MPGMAGRVTPRAKKWLLALGACLGVALAAWLWQVGNTVLDLARAGAFDEVQQREYQADREGNLKAIHRALVMTAESEGAVPGDDWMDQAMLRLKTRDLSEDEAAKKLVRPGVASGYGYGLNEAAAGKPVEDLEAGTVLVFESAQTARNHVGKPEPGLAVTVGGDVVSIPKQSDGGPAPGR